MIYIDKEYKCHVSNPNGEYREIDTSIFQDKCDTYIEGYRYVPSGETWKREDGVVFHGEMVSPWKNYDELNTAQVEYERQQLSECKEALLELGVEL